MIDIDNLRALAQKAKDVADNPTYVGERETTNFMGEKVTYKLQHPNDSRVERDFRRVATPEVVLDLLKNIADLQTTNKQLTDELGYLATDLETQARAIAGIPAYSAAYYSFSSMARTVRRLLEVKGEVR